MLFWNRPDDWNSCAEQTWAILEFYPFESSPFTISENFQYQTRSYLSPLSSHYSYAQIQKTEKKLWLLEHNAQVEEPWIQLEIWTDDDLAKLHWLDTVQK
jgi:hypothetical protein